MKIKSKEFEELTKKFENGQFQHKELAAGGWQKLTFYEQMANVGSEVIRAIKWRHKNKEIFQLAADRALELMYLTNDDPRNIKKLSETLRLYECLADYFYGDNIYQSTEKNMTSYFLAFNYAARLGEW